MEELDEKDAEEGDLEAEGGEGEGSIVVVGVVGEGTRRRRR